MKVHPTTIPGVIELFPNVYRDERGHFMETWNAQKFNELVEEVEFVQDNQSLSDRGVLRGLHYQVVRPQGKLVSVLTGGVFDVAVDLRQSSPTFGQWTGVILSSERKNQLWIPPGFAHGFFALSEAVRVVYKCTDFYFPEHERTIVWNDPTLNIEWPISADLPVLVSEKDRNGLSFEESELFA
ncbi:MAG: dTDP-4-dehydrorhamnose 3,5-epimerase [Pseudomonadota bacterium]